MSSCEQADRRLVAHPQGQAAGAGEHGQRGDERHDPAVGDGDAVDQPEQQAEPDGAEHERRRLLARSTRPPAIGRRRQHRADRQVDAAGGDDERHAHGDDAGHAGLGEDGEQVVAGEERVAVGDGAGDRAAGRPRRRAAPPPAGGCGARRGAHGGRRARRGAVAGPPVARRRRWCRLIGVSCRPRGSWGRAWASTSASVASVASSDRGGPAVGQHEDAVAQADELGQLGRHEHDGRGPPSARCWIDPVDLGLGADVDARGSARRAAGPGSRAAASGPARPSAGCRPTARRRAGRGRRAWCGATRRCSGASRPLGPAVEQAARRRKRRRSATDTLRTRSQPGHRPWVLRSSGARPTPARMARSGRPGGSRTRSPTATRAAVGAVDAVRRAAAARSGRRRRARRCRGSRPRAPRTTTSSTTGSPGAGRSTRSTDAGRARRSGRARGTTSPRLAARPCAAISSDRGVVSGGELGGDGAAVAQHGDGVADRAPPPPAGGRCRRRRRPRSVEPAHDRRTASRPRGSPSTADGSSMISSRASRVSARAIETICLAGGAERPDERASATMLGVAEAVEQLGGAPAGGLAGRAAGPGAARGRGTGCRRRSGRRRGRAPGRWWRRPGARAAAGSPGGRGSPSTSDLARGRRDQPGDALDQRRLAGAVLADEAVDLPGGRRRGRRRRAPARRGSP